MRMKLTIIPKKLLLSVTLLAWLGVNGQGFTAKTNEVVLDLAKDLPTTSNLPVIRWINPKFELTSTEESRIVIEASVTSAIPIKSVRLVVSDKEKGTERPPKDFIIADPKSMQVTQAIFLPDKGSYGIRLQVENEQGGIVADSRSVLVGMGDDILKMDRKDYILLFATDKYEGFDNLVNPIEDSRTIAKELKEKYGFEVELVENATHQKVFETLVEYSQRKFKPQDQLLVFFAGHGEFDESLKEGFVVARNSLASDKGKTTYISHNRIKGILNNSDCEHILLAMDVCFGGTLDDRIARSRKVESYEDTPSKMVARKLSQRTRKYLTSGGKQYVSDGIAGKHSPFAGKLIESLRTYGGADRILTLQEILTNMEVLTITPRTGSFGDDGPLSDFVFIAK
jgi:hypothetical protein